MDLSVIILNYNSGRHLTECLEAARLAVGKLACEFLIADNASVDDSLDRAKRSVPAGQSVRWLSHPQNRGFARGNNPAISACQGRWILLLNPDARVDKDALETMVRYADGESRAGIVGGKLLYPDGQFQWACRRKIPTPRTALARLAGSSAHYNYPDDPDREMEVEAVSGSFMLVRREVFGQVGLLDEQFFMYGEDLDFCLRTRQAGWRILYQPRAVAVHAKGESSRRGSYKVLYEFHRAMWVFYRKHYADRQGWVMRTAVFLGVTLLCASRMAQYPFKSDKRVGSR